MHFYHFFDEKRPYFFWGVGSKAALYEPSLDRFIMVGNDIEILNYVRYVFTNKFPLLTVCRFDDCQNWLDHFPDDMSHSGLDNTNCIFYGIHDKDRYPLLFRSTDQKFIETLEYSVDTIFYDPEPSPGHDLLINETPNMFALYRLLWVLRNLRGLPTVRIPHHIPHSTFNRYLDSLVKYEFIMDTFTDQSSDDDDFTNRHITSIKNWKKLNTKVLETAMYSKEFDYKKLTKLITDEYGQWVLTLQAFTDEDGVK